MRDRCYSLIVDETTDRSTKKSLAVIARVHDDREGKAKDLFLDLIEVTDASAEGLYKAICDLLSACNVPLKNMIGFAADNASVMMGNQRGLQALLKKEVPHILVTGCICHSLHLCASAACTKLPSAIEDLARNVYNYLGSSPKRLLEYQAVQELADVPVHKLLRPSQTRWLSLEAVVRRMYEQWPALVKYFEAASKDDHVQSSKTILTALKDPVFKMYFAFLKYILPLVTKANELFQSESAQIQSARRALVKLYISVAHNYLRADRDESLETISPDNPRNFIPLPDMYCGANVEAIILASAVPDELVASFRLRAQMFYVELCHQIQKCFNFRDGTWKLLEAMDPVTDVQSIIPLAVRFPNIVREEEYETLNTEWRQLRGAVDEKLPDKTLPPEQYWEAVAKVKDIGNVAAFPTVAKFVQSLLALPHSSAAAERVFSSLNLIKTQQRNRLHIDTASSLILAKQHVNPSCYEWEPSAALKARMRDRKERNPHQ